MPCATNVANSTTYTRWVGSGRNSTSRPDSSAPLAVPVMGATALRVVPLARSRSSIPAPTAPMAAPVDSPWAMRANISSGTPCAVANTSMIGACTASAASRTGRRPMWSDKEPTVRRAASTAIA